MKFMTCGLILGGCICCGMMYGKDIPVTADLKTSAEVLQTIQELRSRGQLNDALQVGLHRLEQQPHDVDTMLLIGLIYYQQGNMNEAMLFLKQVLVYSPDYLDAKFALIRVEAIKQNFDSANNLMIEVEKQAPSDPRIKEARTFLNKIEVAELEKLKLPFKLVSIPKLSHLKPTLPNPLKAIQSLRKKGKLNEAIKVAKAYLKQYPKDADVLLQLGLILSQKQEYEEAKQILTQALNISPQYLDVKLGLFTIARAENHPNEATFWLKSAMQQAPHDSRVIQAQALLKNLKKQNELATLQRLYQLRRYQIAEERALSYLTVYPQDEDVSLLLGNIYLAQNKYQPAKNQFYKILTKHPRHKRALIGLIDEEIATEHDTHAHALIRQALKYYPHDTEILVRLSDLYLKEHMYARSAYVSQHILSHDRSNTAAKGTLQSVKDLNPHLLYGLNELGGNTEVDYVSDLHATWQYSTAYYNRDTPWGLASLALNNATRLGFNSNQGMLNFYPVVNRDLYFKLTGAYANQPVLFPTYIGGGEAFFAGLPLEMSGGSYYNYILPNITFLQFTGSLSKEWEQYWLSFRPTYYLPLRGKRSLLYTASLIRFLETHDTYLRVTAGTGTTPDLANLTTVDFLVINNNFVTLNAQFPLFSHRLLMSVGGDYQRWVFPNGRLRNISGATLSLNYRFDDLKGSA